MIGKFTSKTRRVNTSLYFPSPGKLFLLSRLKLFFKNTGKVGLAIDFGAGEFKYKSLFDSKVYVGCDINEKALIDGKRKWGLDNDFGVVLNILDLNYNLPSANIVVCTHTMASFEASHWLKITENFSSLIKDGGSLFINFPYNENKDEKIHRFLTEVFYNVKRIRYSGFFSTYFEVIFNNLRLHKYIRKPVLIIGYILAYILSSVEFFSYTRYNGYYVLYECKGKANDDLLKKDIQILKQYS